MFEEKQCEGKNGLNGELLEETACSIYLDVHGARSGRVKTEMNC